MDNIPKCRITKHAERCIHEHLSVLEKYGIPKDYLYNAIRRACRDAQSFHAKNKYIKCFVIPAHRHFYLAVVYRIDENTNEVIIITVILTSEKRKIDRKCGGYMEVLTLA